MKKNTVITILSVLLLGFVVYSYVKASDAYVNRRTANEYREISIRAEEEADRQRTIALMNFAEAERLSRLLEACEAK